MLNRIRFVLWAIVLTLVAVLAIPTFFHQRAVSREGHGELLTILHTNDHHGHPLAMEGEGGLPQRATLIKQKRAELSNLLLLDAGDLNAGMPISNMNEAEPDILGYNQLGYDAVALGNHEFDKGLPLLEKQTQLAKFPWVCANLKRRSDGALLAKPYIVKDFKNFRVGIFGLSVQAECPDVLYEDAADVARQMVSELRDKEHVQLVIALTHLGIQKDISVQTTSIQLAEQVCGIDLIVDGHAHTRMDEPLVVNGTPIVSAFEFGKQLGEATFEIVNGKPYLLAWRAIPITDEIPADPEMTALLQPYIERIEQTLNEPLATTTAPFDIGRRETRCKETSLSDFICDSVLETARKHGVEADFMFITGGCIRASWPQGTVTYQHVATSLPFDNHLCLVTMDGKQLSAFFDFVGSVPSGAGGFAQFSSEVRYTLHRSADGTGGSGNGNGHTGNTSTGSNDTGDNGSGGSGSNPSTGGTSSDSTGFDGTGFGGSGTGGNGSGDSSTGNTNTSGSGGSGTGGNDSGSSGNGGTGGDGFGGSGSGSSGTVCNDSSSNGTVRDELISDITIQGQPIDPNRKYTLLTSTYLADGGDRYDMLKDAPDKRVTDLLIRDMLLEYLRTHQQPLVPQTDGRIQIIAVPQPEPQPASKPETQSTH